MNKPHIKSLHYQLIPGENVDYKKASPINGETNDFRVIIENDSAHFMMKTHCATEKEARELVEPYLKRWEVLIGLEHDPGDLHFKFKDSEIIELEPGAGNSLVLGSCSFNISVSMDAVLHLSRGRFPSLPQNFILSPDVETMFLRYKSYQEGKESLLSMAYMCLTVLEVSAGGRSQAASRYGISSTVLDKLGSICSECGDASQARKVTKRSKLKALSSNEIDWVLKVIKAIIRRTGEWAYNPNASAPEITMADFPKL